MSAVRIFALGLTALVVYGLAYVFLAYVPVLAAVVMLAAIVAGFCLAPDRDSWIVWVTNYDVYEGEDENSDLYETKEPIAVKTGVARLWLLFLPTLAAVGYLIFVAERGAWEPDLVGDHRGAYLVLLLRAAVVAVWLVIGNWVYERWLLRRADATAIESCADAEGWLAYHFKAHETYFGGFVFPIWTYSRDPELVPVVFYRRNNPERNRLVRAFLFHRFEVAARGVQDLDHAKAVADAAPGQQLG